MGGNLCLCSDILHWSIHPEISDCGGGRGRYRASGEDGSVGVVDIIGGSGDRHDGGALVAVVVLVRLVAVVVVFIDNKCWGALISARSTGADDRSAAEGSCDRITRWIALLEDPLREDKRVWRRCGRLRHVTFFHTSCIHTYITFLLFFFSFSILECFYPSFFCNIGGWRGLGEH